MNYMVNLSKEELEEIGYEFGTNILRLIEYFKKLIKC